MITPEEVRQHCETDLGEEALQRLIDAAQAEVEAAAGPIGELTVPVQVWPGNHRFHLSRPAQSIAEVKEGHWIDDLETVDPALYALVTSGYALERIRGTWARWVQVRYTPVQDLSRREGVILDLVKLALQYEGLHSQEAGDYSATYLDYTAERAKLLKPLQTFRLWVA